MTHCNVRLMSSDATLAKAHSWMSRRPDVDATLVALGSTLFEMVNRPFIAIWDGGGWKLWRRVGEPGQAGLVHACDWRAMLQSVVFMHLSVVRACMKECTGSELGLRGGISEHCWWCHYPWGLPLQKRKSQLWIKLYLSLCHENM